MADSEALKFWSELAIFSARFLERLGLPMISPWGKSNYKGGTPKGVVYHYTLSSRFEKTLRWFCDPKFQSHASAHALVLPAKHEWHAELSQNLSRVQALPVTVIQCRRPTMAANHATWMNREFYGIENVNIGKLTENDDGVWVSRRGEPPVPESEVSVWGAKWVPYTVGQVMANIILTRRLRDLFPGKLKPQYLVGHEQGQGVSTKGSSKKDKRDPGPLFPLWGVREMVFPEDGDLAWEDYPWWVEFKPDPWYGRTWRDGLVMDYIEQHTGRRRVPKEAMKRFRLEVQAWGCNSQARFGDTGKLALQLLGYHVEPGSPVTNVDRASLRLFQRMVGIEYGAPQPMSLRVRARLFERLEDRGIFE